MQDKSLVFLKLQNPPKQKKGNNPPEIRGFS